MVKIYVDSRNRVSGSNEDFVWQIPDSVDLEDSMAYIDCVVVPHTTWSIREGHNDVLRFVESIVASPGATAQIFPRQVVLPAGTYNLISLGTAVQNSIRSVSGIPSAATVVSVEGDIATSRLKITVTDPNLSHISIYPDGMLTGVPSAWDAVQTLFPLDPNNTQSAGKVCGFTGNVAITSDNNNIAYGDSVVDVQKNHCMYIHSDLVQPGTVYGVNQESDVMRRVIIDVPANSIAVDRHATPNDSVDVGSRCLKSMSFRLAGSDGKTVSLRGHHWSFSLIFMPKM